MDDISVMVCDDSALMRNLIGRIVDETQGMTVCGKAEKSIRQKDFSRKKRKNLKTLNQM